jgi:RimJ/RimL family protein N-acetyltransferase
MLDYGYGVMLGDIPEQAREWRNQMPLLAHTRESDYIHPLQQEKWREKIECDPNNRMYGIHIPLVGYDENVTGICSGVRFNSTTTPVGVCGLTNMRIPHRTAEWSLYVAEEFQGNGYATKALKTLVHHGFMALDLRRIWGEIIVWNAPSIKLAEKLGFKVEGTLRKTYYKNGKHVDTIIVGLLKEEWKERISGTQVKL